MGIRDKFQKLLNKAEGNSSAPPIPYDSKPGFSQPPSTAPYWEPALHPSTPVSANFKHELGDWGWGNNEAQNYQGDRRYTSARLSSHQTLGRARGSLSARITAPVASGIWPAFWLLPQDPFQWPNDGEIDIMEAWNGDRTNHTCLHWGHFNGEDWNKHRVIETPIPRIDSPGGVRYDFAWDEDESTGFKTDGTRPMKDFRILINIAVGGNVCQGVMPANGLMSPPGGWQSFDKDFKGGKEGKTM
ncbi:concanavalin A-like lectin/glucanase [Gymnopus androsaceus JB14]|uniref:Concanavalin A-like lectin/glucanase n=1 Tax=Gymnopus androsaceus JB14 TaxID=1447944 RepID=A0A6A4H0H4_9AGAR|nr:concanavalin A-like lectin/glucanase [Gymnopus androsaceus JB14]